VSADVRPESGEKGHASVTIRRRVEWPDTDAAGRYHHSTVIRWVEAAEAELLDSLALIDVFGSVPRVHYEVDYLAPLFFRDEVELELTVESVGRSSVRYTFEARRLRTAGGDDVTIAAKGALVAVLVGADDSGPTDWNEQARHRLLGGR
jgi:acyl-CoA thioester hydrolase